MKLVRNLTDFFDVAKEGHKKAEKKHEGGEKKHEGGGKRHKSGEKSSGGEKEKSSEHKTPSHSGGKRAGSSNPLHLQILKTPQLQKLANVLYQNAIGETDDHATYAAYLVDLDKLLRGYAGRKSGEDSSDDSEGESDSEANADEKWK